MMRYGILALFNLIFIEIFIFWVRLRYWCAEGYVPVYMVFISILVLIVLWIMGNRALIKSLEIRTFDAIVMIVCVVVVIRIDPIAKPLYMKSINEVTMKLSIMILDYYQKI